jgi:hypothetical protein
MTIQEKPRRRGNQAGQRTCRACNRTPDETRFYRDSSHPDGLSTYCRDCTKNASATFYSKNREQINNRRKSQHDQYKDPDRKYRRKQRAAVITAYGDRCACCDEARIEFLAIDHVNGGGNAHRREMGGCGNSITRLLYRRLRAGEPNDTRFRVLCHNCNLSIGFYGYCPHERERGYVDIRGVTKLHQDPFNHIRKTDLSS